MRAIAHIRPCRQLLRCRVAKCELVVALLVGCLVLWISPVFSWAQELNVSRDSLAVRLQALIGSAKDSLYIAASDCTLSLVSADVRVKARDPAIGKNIGVVLQQNYQCKLRGFEPPRPFDLRLSNLEPIRVDRHSGPSGLSFRREFLIIDRKRVLFILSELALAEPREFSILEIDPSAEPDGQELVNNLGNWFWPRAFSSKSQSKNAFQPRWSMDNHRRLTDESLRAIGFAKSAVSIVEQGNVWVDRLANQFNNPQHSMRNLGQSIEDAKREAAAWIESRRVAGLQFAQRGKWCQALCAMGEGLHTIQDRKHGWIFLYQHLFNETISDYRRSWAPEEWEVARKETAEWCGEFIEQLKRDGEEAASKLMDAADPSCRCDVDRGNQ